MTNVAQQQAPSEGSAMHKIARSGFDSSGGSGLYDRARPSYPPAAIASIVAEATNSSSPSPLRIVELGAGTGIATRMLLAAATSTSADGTPPPGIASLTAIEPSAGMRSHFESAIASGANSLKQQLQDKGLLSPSASITIEDGAFESFDAGSGNDAVVVAQAWHWCQDWDAALGQVAKALRSDGILALIWNLEDREAAPWVAQIRDLYEKYEDNTPQYRHMYWHAMYKAPTFASHFKADEPRHYHRTIPTTLQGVLDRVLSKSYISVLPKDKQDELVKDISDYLNNTSDEQLGRKWIDKEQGVWEYPYRTDLFIFRRV
ncbi:Methyltransf_11 domain-containing protein [Pseudozyma hubeiensis]|nr:Methyltransf_11 domain-containing protein [Pseudozyma hubeiensis]